MAKKTSASRPHFLWITDPWTTLDHSRDTTLRLATEATLLGYGSDWCDVKSLRWEGTGVRLEASPLLEGLKLGKIRTASPADFRSIHYRTDPPVDLAYQHPLQILALGVYGKKGSEIVNPPEVLLTANEKLEAGLLGPLMPPSVASSEWEILNRFGKREGRTVLKPIFQAQSKGVELLDWRSPSGVAKAKKLLAIASENFTRPVQLQRYLEGILEGEVRLWFLDGKLLAWVKKLPLQGDFRVNLDRGSGLAEHSLSAAEKRIAAKIGKHLQAREIRLAAVDLIEGMVTDFNFTSPGLIVLMEKVLRANLARPIIQALARRP